jgi:hypothetical protein
MFSEWFSGFIYIVMGFAGGKLSSNVSRKLKIRLLSRKVTDLPTVSVED